MPFFGGGASAGIGGSTGATDNAILRADGTGGATLQNSALVIDDPVSPLTNVTGVASTDLITVVGHNFVSGQAIRFLSVTGGAGFPSGSPVVFVRDLSGDQFRISTTLGGAAVNFTTDITAGSVVAVQERVTLKNNAPDTNSSVVISPKGTGAFIFGPEPDGTVTGGNHRGSRAVDFQTERSSATMVAAGTGSFIAGGATNTAVGSYSFSCGQNNNASSSYSFIAAGADNTSSGFASAVIAGQFASASASHSLGIGLRALSNRYAMIAHGAGQFSAVGDAQRAFFVLRCKTTTNAAVEMALDGSTTYLTIPSGKVIFCNIKVVGTKSDGSAVATYERQYAAKNVAGTSSEVFAPVTIGTDLASGTSLEVATVDAGDYIRIRPTGIASETWRWVASVDAVEVAYGT